MPLVNIALFPSMRRRASCLWQERPRALGKAKTMEKISTNTRFHLSIPMCFWLIGISTEISLKRFSQCGGKDNAMLNVSITHPRSNYQVNHIQLPALRLFSNKTSLRLSELPESQGQNNLSREWNKVLCTRL